MKTNTALLFSNLLFGILGKVRHSCHISLPYIHTLFLSRTPVSTWGSRLFDAPLSERGKGGREESRWTDGRRG